jgi:hypothetical protein
MEPKKRVPSEFEVKLRKQLDAMPRSEQYRIVKIGMLALAISIALRIIVFIYKLLK